MGYEVKRRNNSQGQLLEEGEYVDGVLNGYWKLWPPAGKGSNAGRRHAVKLREPDR